MQTLSMNRKIVMSIVIVMLLISGIQTTSHGQQFTPVSERTPQVRDAIVALVPGVDSADDVTAAHLSLISNLNLSEQNITTLKAGDFDGLSSLDSLALYKNRLRSLPADLFSGMSALSRLDLGSNDLSSLPADVFSELSSLSWLSLSFNQLNRLSVDTFSGLSSLNTLNLSYNKLNSLSAEHFSEVSSLRTLNLSSNKLSGLPSDLFSGVSSLSWLSLSFNELVGLPAGIFSGLPSLRSFYLGDNAVNLSITVFLERIEEHQFKASAPTGAPFNILLPLSVVNGAIDGGATTIEIPAGNVESEPLTVTPTPGASDPVAVDIVVFPELPTGHYGYSLAEPSSLAGDNDSLIFAVGIPRQGYEPNVNHAPIFAEGISTIRSVAENTAAGVNIGGPVVATDEDDDPLTYGIQGPDAAAFGIVGTTGQLQTRAPLDYETRDAYAVTVIVSDGRGGADTIGVTINVTDENDDPIFIEGDSTIRSVPENTQAGMNIGGAVAATDEDGDPLTYTLGGIDAAAFGIVGTTGQLQTRAPLDYETQDAYSVTVLVSDGKGGTDTIGVAISVTDENDDPIFIEGDSTTRSVAENTAAGVNIGAPVSATDEDGDTLIYRLGGVDAGSFGIIGSSGQLQTRAPLDYETQNAYSVAIMVSDGKGGTDTIGVAISITDEDEAVPDEDPVPVVERIVIPPVAETVKTHPPVFASSNATRSIAENTPAGVNIGSPVSATDTDGDTLIYGLGGIDATSFRVVSTSGQLKTHAPLHYETKNAYSVTVTVSDGSRTDTIIVTITITDVDETPKTRAPVFAGDKTTRSIAENTPAGVNIGSPVSATDADDDTLTYSLSGTDRASFKIVSTSGQLKTHTPLDYETKNAYSVTVTASDGSRTDTIIVTITITDVDETPENQAPAFTGDKTTRSIAENTPAGVNIGSPVSATDTDGDTLIYGLSGVDATSFRVVSTSGQLKTHAPLDYETKNAYSVTVTVSDGSRTDTIIVTITITDVDETPKTHAPVFAGDKTTRSIAENTPAGVNIGKPVSATDADDDTLTYSLSGTDSASFRIVSTSGQLKTHAPLDYEKKKAYSVTVTVSDGDRTDTISVAITITDVDETVRTHAPVFAGDRVTRFVAENTPADVKIGRPVSATDADDDTLTYSLGGTDAVSFSIVSSSGQLKTHAPLDYEKKKAYAVTVTVSDGSRIDSINVAITVIDVDEGEASRPARIDSEISISEIMFGSEIRFTPKQWIEISNSGTKAVDLTGWKLTVQNVNSEDLLGPATLTVKFSDSTFDDAPRIWPNDVLLIVTSKTGENSGDFSKDQIYDLRWIEGVRKDTVDIGFWTTWMSTEGFRITLTDKDGNLVDEVGNYDGNTTLWDLPYGFNRGRIREGNRTSMIRRYVDGLPLDGTQAGSWIPAVDANLTADQRTYYGDKDDISTPGIGIVVNDISPDFTDYDVNHDGVVDIADLVIVTERLGQSGPNIADVNGDGVVTVKDLIEMAAAVGQAPAAPSLHPEALSRLTAADIREWLSQAYGLDPTDPKLLKGIFFLEQLLSVLVPKETELLPNYPNPFNPETWIPYRLSEDGFVTLRIYDQQGRVVRRLDVGPRTASVYESRSKAIYWDGRNEAGDRVASGIYFYTLIAGDYSATRKMVILK